MSLARCGNAPTATALGRFLQALGICTSAQDLVRIEPLPTDSTRRDSCWPSRSQRIPPGDMSALPRTRVLSAREHAAELLAWLQGPGGRTGTIAARVLTRMHQELCAERDFELRGWDAVARELRRLLKQRKLYGYVNGRRAVIFEIPPAGQRDRRLDAATSRLAA
jgi:hypothetical protein